MMSPMTPFHRALRRSLDLAPHLRHAELQGRQDVQCDGDSPGAWRRSAARIAQSFSCQTRSFVRETAASGALGEGWRGGGGAGAPAWCSRCRRRWGTDERPAVAGAPPAHEWCSDGRWVQRGAPGMVAAIQTFGSYANFHPHIHALVTNGGDGRSIALAGGRRVIAGVPAAGAARASEGSSCRGVRDVLTWERSVSVCGSRWWWRGGGA
jgi:hypothetical protein